MAWHPTPTALQSGLVAAFKYRGQNTSWPDESGTYSLTNNNTVQAQKYQTGKAFVGAASLCDWTAIESWSTDHADLRRVGSASTKCAFVFFTAADFDAQNTAVGFLNNVSNSDTIRYWIRYADPGVTPQFSWRAGATSTNTNFSALSFDFTEPLLVVYKTNGVDSTTAQAYLLSTGAQVYSSTVAAAPAASTVEHYGHLSIASSVYNGSQTILDGIQIFNSVLSDADLQSICTHWRTQKSVIRNFLSVPQRRL